MSDQDDVERLTRELADALRANEVLRDETARLRAELDNVPPLIREHQDRIAALEAENARLKSLGWTDLAEQNGHLRLELREMEQAHEDWGNDWAAHMRTDRRLRAALHHFAGIYDALLTRNPNLPGGQKVGITMDELRAAKAALGGQDDPLIVGGESGAALLNEGMRRARLRGEDF